MLGGVADDGEEDEAEPFGADGAGLSDAFEGVGEGFGGDVWKRWSVGEGREGELGLTSETGGGDEGTNGDGKVHLGAFLFFFLVLGAAPVHGCFDVAAGETFTGCADPAF